MKSNIGMTHNDRDGVVKAPTALLPDESQCEELDNTVDEVAVRARAVSGHASGTLQEFTQHARVKEHPPPIRLVER